MEMWGIVFAFLVLIAFSVVVAVIGGLLGRRTGKGLVFGSIAFIAPSLLVSLLLGGCYSVQEARSAMGLKHFWFFVGICGLPNGYEFTFDSKFRIGYIAKRGSLIEHSAVSSVSALQVMSNSVAGRVSSPGFGKESFFLLNTQTGKLENVTTLDELSDRLGKKATLQEPSVFFENAR